MNIFERIKYRRRYKRTWGTPIGQDCISLDTTLCKWLGERMLFLAEHTQSFDPRYVSFEEWQRTLRVNAYALLGWANHWDCGSVDEEHAAYEQAQAALRWIADNLGTLWD